MRGSQDVPAALRRHPLHQPARLPVHVLRRSVRQEALRVHPAHERKAPAEFPLQLQRVHARAVALHWVENVQPDLDQVRDDRGDGPARVVRHPQAARLADSENPVQPRPDTLTPAAGTHHHALLTTDVVPGPQPIQREPLARLFRHPDRELARLLEHPVAQLGWGRQVEQPLLHTAKTTHHLEETRRDVAADEHPVGLRHHRLHVRQELVDLAVRVLVPQDRLVRRPAQRRAPDLVEVALLHPLHTPRVHVRIAVAFVHHSLHGMVVPHPRLADVVAHHLGHELHRDLQSRCKSSGRVRVEPHEDRHPVHRLTPQRRMNALLRQHPRLLRAPRGGYAHVRPR